jgi:hypothetical protein
MPLLAVQIGHKSVGLSFNSAVAISKAGASVILAACRVFYNLKFPSNADEDSDVPLFRGDRSLTIRSAFTNVLCTIVYLFIFVSLCFFLSGTLKLRMDLLWV